MYDISKCSTENCVLEKYCFRKLSIPNEYYQSYANFDCTVADGYSCFYLPPYEMKDEDLVAIGEVMYGEFKEDEFGEYE